MPGANCVIFGCGTCRNQKEFGIFKLPSGKTEDSRKWREELVSSRCKFEAETERWQSFHL